MQQALKPARRTAWAQVVATGFSLSSTSPWTKRRPRLTRVSEGNDFRRLDVMSKAGEVVEIAMLAHGTPPKVTRPDCRAECVPWWWRAEKQFRASSTAESRRLGISNDEAAN